jgi:hypothetical protein
MKTHLCFLLGLSYSFLTHCSVMDCSLERVDGFHVYHLRSFSLSLGVSSVGVQSCLGMFGVLVVTGHREVNSNKSFGKRLCGCSE